MGTRFAPTIANIFMGTIEKKIFNQSPLLLHIFDQFWRHFIDDVLLIWTGSEIQLKEFLKFINSLYSTIKITANFQYHFCTLQSQIEMEKWPLLQANTFTTISTSIIHLILLKTFNSHWHIKFVQFEMQLDELKQMLLNRNFPITIIEKAFTRTRQISIIEAIERVNYKKSSTNKVTFPYPRLPKISEITSRHFDLMKRPTLCQNIWRRGRNCLKKTPKHQRHFM